MNNPLRLGFCLLVVLLLLACDKGPGLPRLPADAVILAFGDSLTHGSGVEEANSYPAQLQRLIGHRVINSGVPGEISAEGVRRLSSDLEDYQPALLLLCHGGNDLLRRMGLPQLRENLQRMILSATQRGIPVVLIAVPQPNLLLDDASVFKEVAEELKIPLLADILTDLLGDRRYKSDQVHLNAAGYRKLAEAIATLLEKRGAL